MNIVSIILIGSVSGRLLSTGQHKLGMIIIGAVIFDFMILFYKDYRRLG
jgi:hypothetical protein